MVMGAPIKYSAISHAYANTVKCRYRKKIKGEEKKKKNKQQVNSEHMTRKEHQRLQVCSDYTLALLALPILKPLVTSNLHIN